jgi:hypothetical protein
MSYLTRSCRLKRIVVVDNISPAKRYEKNSTKYYIFGLYDIRQNLHDFQTNTSYLRVFLRLACFSSFSSCCSSFFFAARRRGLLPSTASSLGWSSSATSLLFRPDPTKSSLLIIFSGTGLGATSNEIGLNIILQRKSESQRLLGVMKEENFQKRKFQFKLFFDVPVSLGQN